MLWSIDSCQNKVSADQYHLSESRAQVSTHRGHVFFWSYPLIRYWFSNDRRLKFICLKSHMKYVAFMCRTIKILISNWPRTRKFSQLLQAGKAVAFDFSHHVHALVTLYVQFLRCPVSDILSKVKKCIKIKIFVLDPEFLSSQHEFHYSE